MRTPIEPVARASQGAGQSAGEPAPLTLTESQALLARARAITPGETSSLMKRPQMFAPGAFPVFLASGQGARVTDVDGQDYVDYICGLGANTLGHNHPAVAAALRAALGDGLSHSLPTPLEVETMEALLALIPGAEQGRFFKTGADATSAAVRLARAHTGRERIAVVGYNGWHDHFMFDTAGVPEVFAEYTRRMPLFAPDDEPRLLSLIEAEGDSLALLLLSVPYNRTLAPAFLQRVQAACRDKGVLFALDEVVTGFRLALGGAQAYFEVEADLVCLSKGLAAGMPLSALVGPRRVMQDLAELQVSTTFGGERLSLAACGAALGVYRDTPALTHMADLGVRLRDGIERVARAAGSALRVRGYASIPCFVFAPDPDQQTAFMTPFVAGMAARGVLLRRDVNFLSAAHTVDQVDHTIAAAGETLRALSARGAGGA